MKNDLDKDFVMSILKNGGFQVDTISELPEYKTPDLKVTLPKGVVLLEVKSKENDLQLRDLLESPKGALLHYNVSIIETVLRDGYRQIRDFPGRSDADFSLIWFITRKIGGATILVNPAAKLLLYGIESLEGRMIDGDVFDPVDCYFFNESFFFKRKELDGVVLYNTQSVELCLNPFSPRHNAFSDTKIAAFFHEHYVIVSTKELVAAGNCFIADCNNSRQDKNGTVRHIKRKYGLDQVNINRYYYVNVPVD